MVVNIIVTTYNYLPFTKLCVKSIRENTHSPYKLIFVDDGSTDGTVVWLRKNVPDAVVIENDLAPDEGWKGRHGWWGGINLGLDYEKADYYAFVDRDNVVTDHWLTKLIELLEQQPRIGIVSPHRSTGSGEQSIPQGGPLNPNNIVQKFYGGPDSELWKQNDGAFLRFLTYEEIQKFGKMVDRHYAHKFIYQAPLWFQCVLLPHKTVAKVGKFDVENFFWRSGDEEYCYRCLKAGLLTAVRLDAYAHSVYKAEGVSSWERNKGGYYDPYYKIEPGWEKKYGWKPTVNMWQKMIPHKRIMRLREM